MIFVCIDSFLTLLAKPYRLETDSTEPEMEGTTGLLKELLSAQGLPSNLIIWTFQG